MTRGNENIDKIKSVVVNRCHIYILIIYQHSNKRVQCFILLHSSRGTYIHSHNFSITVSFFRSHCSHIFKSASGAHGLLIASNAF